MIQVLCPKCNKTRTVKIWKKKWGAGPPYVKLCTTCSKIGRVQSEEDREKKRQALQGIHKPPEYSDRLKLRHELDPTLRQHLVPGAGAGHNKGETTGPMPEETKEKISESMKKHHEEKSE